VLTITKRFLVGRPLRSARLGETLLPKRLALPVFCSDPLSSNAYATEEILRALSLGGLALLFLTPWVALGVVVLLAVVVVSYRQTCYAYPNGGGAYAVSRENLGRSAALVAASALLVEAVFGYNSVFFFLMQAFTAAILVLAANTAFNGFPILASILGRDGYLPRQFGRRGDRLVFSNGILILAVLAGLLIWAFDASTSRLIQLYIIGVFVSFTLSQAGMVRHWTTLLRSGGPEPRSRLRRARLINAAGAILTAVVLIVVLITKFTHGAYLVVIAMPALFALMKAIERHYRHVGEELAPGPGGISMPSRVQAVVLVSRLDLPTLQALAYAKATRPDRLTALTVATAEAETHRLESEWAKRNIPIPLTVVDAPYRDITGPVLRYVAELRDANPRNLVVVYIPEYVVGRPWEQLLHNQSALRLKARLLFQRGVLVTSVPWQLQSSRRSEQEEERALKPETARSMTGS
jgi:hypothetical protein